MEGLAGTEEAASEAVFHGKIEFHVARKQFNGFGNGSGSGNGFKMLTLNPNASEPHKASGSGKKPERSEHLETGFDPELSFRITYRRIGAGLRNLGNTCFLNSVLQCLTYTEPLAAYLQSGKHQNSCHTTGFCSLCAIQKHVSRALQSTGRILEPKDLVSNLRRISRNFRNARQEDAHEYMVNLLESMHKCCLPSGVPSESPNAYEKSLVHKIFGGRLRSQVKCMQCSYCSNKFDPFLDLSLEIHKADSLYKALAHFTAKEQLDGGAKQYQCQQCKQKVKAFKQLTIYKAPNVLTIHLKRFGSHAPGQKINKNVAFRSNLDLKHFVTGPYEGDSKYTLYGVLVHAGWSTHSGHYYCFVRTSSGMWYTLDDNQVYQVSEKKVLAQKAYMLFYVRDGGNFCAQKPGIVNHKENMAENATLNQELRLKTQNGFVEKRLDSSSAALPEKDAPKEIPLKNIPHENLNRNIAVDCSDIKRDPQSEPPLEDCSAETTNYVGCEAESKSTTDGPGAATISGHDANMVECNNRLSGTEDENIDEVNKNQIESVQNPPFSSDFCAESGVVCNIKGFNSCDGKAVPAGIIEEASYNIDSIESSKKRSIEECQVGIFSRSDDSNLEISNHSLPDKPTTTEQLSCPVTKNNRPKLKLKRKLFMYQISSMPLSSNMIFGTAFAMQKKHKRKKHHSLQNKRRNVKSESETAKKVNFASYDDEKCISMHNASDSKVISGDVVNNELRRRLKTDKTVVLSEKSKNTMESRQTNMFNVLTRGLEETTVARWDDIEVSHCKKAELGRVENERIIGYVGDDWDEEYDRGKRRKIKSSKISIDGPNLFQEIVSRKDAKRKRAKLH